MAFNLGQITASLSLNISRFSADMTQAMQQISALGNNLRGAFGANAQNNLNATGKAAQNLNGHFKDMERIVGGILISQAFYSGAQAIQQAIAGVVQFSNSLEVMQIQLEYFLGSKREAEAFLLVMKDFAATTPFATEQATRLSVSLMNAGYAAENVKHVMTILSDTAAATGATREQMDRIVLAITQIRHQGFLGGQEIRQLADANINVYGILSEQLGLTADQLKKIGKLKIPGDKAVAALLKGFEEKFAGAGKKISNTVTGMWGTIKDDFLINSDIIFEKPLEAMGKFVRVLRDYMEEARDILEKGGIGALFEKIVPEKLQNSIRNIAGAFMSMGKSIGELIKAFKPVAETIGTVLVVALERVSIVVAALTKIISTVVTAAMNASPAVRFFAAAVGTLLIAGVVAKSLMFLWSVTRMGVICMIVGRAVMFLSQAIRLLFLTMSRNPLVGITMLIAAALLYLAMSSKTVTVWLDQLSAKLSSLAGIEPGGIFQPDFMKDMSKDTEKYNQLLQDLNKDLKGTGKEAEKAGKKVKDKFVASFDELYQVPDLLDKVEDGLDDSSDIKMPDLPNMDIPNVNLPDMNLPGDLPGSGDIPWWAVGRHNRPKPWNPPPNNNVPPPDAAPATSALETINSRIAAMKIALTDTMVYVSEWIVSLGNKFANGAITVGKWIGDTSTGLADWALTNGLLIKDWGSNFVNDLKEWSNNTGAVITGWVVDNTNYFATWSEQSLSTVVNWGKESLNSLTTWVTNSAEAISRWSLVTGKSFLDWATSSYTGLLKWSSNTYETVSSWIKNTIGDFATWSTAVTQEFMKWSTNTLYSMVEWSLNAGSTVANWTLDTTEKFKNWSIDNLRVIYDWASNTVAKFSSWGISALEKVTTWASTTKTRIAAWAANTAENINIWVSDTVKTFSAWSSDAAKTISTWTKGTATDIYKWADNAGNNILSWAKGSANNISSWGTETSTVFVNWVNGTSTGFYEWAKNASTNIVAFSNSTYQTLSEWAGNSWKAISSWLSGTASGIYDWAKNTIGNIVNWAKSAWQTIKNLASTVGSTVGDWFGAASDGISSAYNGMANWASENKNWLIPAGITAGIVLTAIALAPATGGWSLAPLLALETGGIVDKDQLVRIGEGNKREAVIPLQNSTYMKPFSAAVASDLAQMMGTGNSMGNNTAGNDTRPQVHIWNYIGDERSLKELERRMQVIRVSEDQRRGL